MKLLTVLVLFLTLSFCSNNHAHESTTASFIYIAGCDSIFYSSAGKADKSAIKGSKKDDSAFIYKIVKENSEPQKIILIKTFGGYCGGVAETATNLQALFAAKKITALITMPDSTEEEIFNDVSLEKAIQKITAENGGIMRMNVPKDEETDTLKINAAAAMTLLPTGNNRLFYYQGEYKNIMTETNYTGIRKVITAFRQKTNSKEVMFLIKSDSAASFKNIIDLLDEMVICKVPKGHYAEVEITENEKGYIKSVTAR